MTEAPRVTVLIPARNEEADIERCLEAVLGQDHPHNRLEIVLVDGGSTDRTAAVAATVLAAGDVDWKIIDNPVGTTPSNLNTGLAVASGEILCRVDARSIIPPDYVRRCVEVLETRPEVMVTGGAQVAVAVDGSATSVGIARALNNQYAMGGSRYRSGAPSGPSDTVYLGAFRTEQLRAAGGWDEYFETNQDYELNRRMGRQGVIWFDDRLSVDYVPRQTLRLLWKQYHRFGRWKVRYWRRTEDPPRARQIVVLCAPPVGVFAGVPALRRVRRPLTIAVAAVSSVLFVVDAAGSELPASATVRVRSIAAMVLVGGAWTSGVLREVARKGPS